MGRKHHRDRDPKIPMSDAAEAADEAYVEGLADGTAATGVAYEAGFEDGVTAEAIAEADDDRLDRR